MVRIQKQYVFEGVDGRASLRDLFEGRRRLIVYHFPFDPAWDGDCGSSSHLADRFAGGIVDLPARDTSFAAVSPASIAKIESCRRRMDWTFRWLSSLGGDFNDDFRVTPGLSVFLRHGDGVFHAYSTYQRSLDALLGAYDSVDVTRRHRHDRFPPQQARR
jgi:predicted dithiol-disulfide oxidoreductase (DUF899 family)